MATGAARRASVPAGISSRAEDQPGVRRADRIVVCCRLAEHGQSRAAAPRRARAGPRHPLARIPRAARSVCRSRRQHRAPDRARAFAQHPAANAWLQPSGELVEPRGCVVVSFDKLRTRAVCAGQCPSNGTRWMDEVPEGPAIVIANQVLDALPIQLVFVDGVGMSGWSTSMRARLELAVGPRAMGGTGRARSIAAVRSHRRRAEDELLAQGLGSPLAVPRPAQPATGDTLQAVRPARLGPAAPIYGPRTVRAQDAAGLVSDGPMTQAEFLGRLGVAERAAPWAATPKAATSRQPCSA